MAERLKPCPFCGGSSDLAAAGLTFAVICTDCGTEMEGHTEAEAVALWNRRAETAIEAAARAYVACYDQVGTVSECAVDRFRAGVALRAALAVGGSDG